MDEHEARRLAAQIDGERGWHVAEVRQNGWTGEWVVAAYQGDDEYDEENSYTLRYRGEWYRLQAGLASEAAEAVEEAQTIDEATRLRLEAIKRHDDALPF